MKNKNFTQEHAHLYAHMSPAEASGSLPPQLCLGGPRWGPQSCRVPRAGSPQPCELATSQTVLLSSCQNRVSSCPRWGCSAAPSYYRPCGVRPRPASPRIPPGPPALHSRPVSTAEPAAHSRTPDHPLYRRAQACPCHPGFLGGVWGLWAPARTEI